MSLFNISDISRSTKTKQTEFFLPTLYLTPEEQREEDQRFFQFISDTTEGESFTQFSTLERQQQENFGEYFELKEDFYRQASKSNPGKTDKIIESWRLDRSDTPQLSITVAPEGYGLFQPRKLAQNSWQNVDEFTFAGGSIWGALLDREAAAPQFVELLGRNAQANHYAAIRARGGLQGELWQTAVSKSPWLSQMLKESNTVREELNSWIDASPTALSLKGSTPFSAYGGTTLLDILEDAEVPLDWNPKQAIEELKIADPYLANLLFDEIGVKEDRLIELGKNPIQFKYFIADVIDQHAYSSFLAEYQKQAGTIENFYATMAWPLIRDSFNSNDNFSELLVIAGGVALSTTGVGAAAGIPMIVAGASSRLAKVYKGYKAIDKFETTAKFVSRAAQFNSQIWKAKKFLPNNLTDTVFDATGITKKLFYTAEQAADIKKTGTFLQKSKLFTNELTKQFIGEAAQGVVESVVNQANAMENGLQANFSIGQVAYNALEEGIGGAVLGFGIRKAGNIGQSLSTTKAANFITTKLSEQKAELIATLPKLSNTAKSNLRIATTSILGIPKDVDFDTFQGAVETELRLTALVERVKTTTGFGDILTPGEKENPLVSTLVTIISNGDINKETAARIEILKRLDAAITKTTDISTGKSNLSGDDIEALLFMSGISSTENNEGARTKLIESVWLSNRIKEGTTTNKEGKPLSIIDATEDEIKATSEQIAEKINGLVVKLGASSSEEVDAVFNKNIQKEDADLMLDAINEEKETLEPGKTVSIDVGTLPISGIVPSTISKPDEVKEELPTDKTKQTEVKEKTEEETFEEAVKVVEKALESDEGAKILASVIMEDFKNIEEVELTEDERNDLINRTCFREGI
jgi:hypothetical protein